jgi:membrane protein implicated in regulation of membrane protease activity
MNLSFGVYGGYVWSAVGLFVFVTLVNLWAARAAYSRARERASRANAKDQEPRSA